MPQPANLLLFGSYRRWWSLHTFHTARGSIVFSIRSLRTRDPRSCEELSSQKRLLKVKPTGGRSRGKPRFGLLDGVKADLAEKLPIGLESP